VSFAIHTEQLRKVYPAPPPARGRPGPSSSTVPSREIVALESLDLDVPQGEFFGLLGPNGAGKTTTIGILTTRIRATAGRAIVSGVDVRTDAVGVRQRIGVVPQQPNPDRGLNVRENLVFHAAYFGIPRGVATRRALALLDTLGIGEKREARIEHLSGGQQQRLMIARALIHEPRVLFLDEPTVGLDPQARLALWEILREMHASGRTIIMTTHYMEEAERLCQRVAIVDRGRLLAIGTPERLKADAPGGTLIELTLDGDAASVADEVRRRMSLERVEASDSSLRVYSDRGGELIPSLIGVTQSTGRTVTNIHLAPPSLETLFVSLTGRKLD
jgi:ABC-2 type transport system ATP-binding protein